MSKCNYEEQGPITAFDFKKSALSGPDDDQWVYIVQAFRSDRNWPLVTNSIDLVVGLVWMAANTIRSLSVTVFSTPIVRISQTNYSRTKRV